MKSSVWRISTYSCLAAALLFIAFGPASAETLLGKVTLLRADGRTDVYPVVSGKKIEYADEALIRLTGATFVAEEGSALEVTDQGGNFDVNIEKGVVHFRVQPHKAVISFLTKDGSFDTPRVVTAASTVIEGTVTVNDKWTKVELAGGTVSVLTADGLKTIKAGEGIVLAQADPGSEEPTIGTEDVVVDTPAEDATTEPGATGDTGSPYVAPAVMGVAVAGAATGVIIGVATGNDGGGDSVGSPIE